MNTRAIGRFAEESPDAEDAFDPGFRTGKL
jgi:hypothetical protein